MTLRDGLRNEAVSFGSFPVELRNGEVWLTVVADRHFARSLTPVGPSCLHWEGTMNTWRVSKISPTFSEERWNDRSTMFQLLSLQE